MNIISRKKLQEYVTGVLSGVCESGVVLLGSYKLIVTFSCECFLRFFYLDFLHVTLYVTCGQTY